MILRITGFLLLLLLPFCVFAQSSSIDGRWMGAINIQGQDLNISVMFTSSNGEVDGVLDIPQQNAFNLPVDVPYLSADSVHFEFQTGTGVASFHSLLDQPLPNELKGVFKQSGMEFSFYLERVEADAATSILSEREQVISVDLGTHTLTGNLVIPDEDENILIILASGSGSQDRNSGVAGFEVFKKLAKELSDAGFSSFRFDDRGVGESTGEPDATLHELGDDLIGLVNYFREEMEQFQKIYILGHSQGGITGGIAAKQSTVDGLILLAAPVLSGDEIIIDQIRQISAYQKISDEIVEQNLIFQKAIYEAVRTGEGWSELEEDLTERLKAQIDELPEQQREALGNLDDFVAAQVARQLSGAKTRWFRSFIETDPLSLYNNLNIPVLAIFGEKDIQVIAESNSKALSDLSRENIQIKTIPEANHLFQQANTGMPGEYGVLDKEFTDGFLEAILGWLRAQS